jgi:hypothetical protein
LYNAHGQQGSPDDHDANRGNDGWAESTSEHGALKNLFILNADASAVTIPLSYLRRDLLDTRWRCLRQPIPPLLRSV